VRSPRSSSFSLFWSSSFLLSNGTKREGGAGSVRGNCLCFPFLMWRGAGVYIFYEPVKTPISVQFRLKNGPDPRVHPWERHRIRPLRHGGGQ
jgi:hypothetical protein